MTLKPEMIAVIMSTKIVVEEVFRLKALGYIICKSDAAGRVQEMGKHVNQVFRSIRNVLNGEADYTIGKETKRMKIAEIME